MTLKKADFEHKGAHLCFFCLGKLCHVENWKNAKGNIAIKGLHSNIIADVLVASQRPSARLIKEYNVIE